MKRKIIIICGLSFIAVLSVFLALNHLAEEQIKKDRNFIDNEMKPAIIFVKDFYEKNGYCPVESDFRHTNLQCKGRIDIHIEGTTFKDENYDDFKKEIIIPKNEYIIWIWRGEWAELYYSYTNKIYSNNGIEGFKR